MNTLTTNVKSIQTVAKLVDELQDAMAMPYHEHHGETYYWHKVIYQPFVSDYKAFKRAADPTFTLTDTQETHIGKLLEQALQHYYDSPDRGYDAGLDTDLEEAWALLSPQEAFVEHTPDIAHIGRGGKHCVINGGKYKVQQAGKEPSEHMYNLDEVSNIMRGVVDKNYSKQELIMLVQASRAYTQEKCIEYFAHEVDYRLEEDRYPVEQT